MKNFLMIVVAAFMMLPTHAAPLNDGENYNAAKAESELLYHTAAPGLIMMPRIDEAMMVTAYDLTILPREGNVHFRWTRILEDGQSEGFWTRWRDYDGVYPFTTLGRYAIEAYAETLGKERSPSIYVTFNVDYLGFSAAPGIKIEPTGERGYYVSLISPYGNDIYYRWRDYDVDVWYKWRLYTEEIPFTSGGKYVIEAQSEGDIVGACLEVPNVDYVKTGDVDHNGTVNLNDLTALINMLLNPEICIGTGDVNKDGNVSISDVTALINLLLKSNNL